MWNRLWHQTRNRSGLFEYNAKTWNEWLSNSCCTTAFPPFLSFPPIAPTRTTSPAPPLSFPKIAGGTAAIITVIYKILSIRYRFHCCSRVDGPVQKWAGDRGNLTNAIPLCRCRSFKHTEVPVLTGRKAGGMRAAQIFHVPLFISVKVCRRWSRRLLPHFTCNRLLFLLYSCFKKKDAILLLDFRGEKNKFRCHIITFVSQHLSVVLANQTGALESRP